MEGLKMKLISKATIFLINVCFGVLVAFSLSMSIHAQDKMCFPPHTGVPYSYSAPTIDGFVEPDVGLSAHETFTEETGWVHSMRVRYCDDTGMPQMLFQGLKHESDDFIYLSFMVRGDVSFDNEDMIILVFRPDYTNVDPAVAEFRRRIDIYPVHLNVGAGTAPPEVVDGAIRIRKDRDPRDVNYFKWDTTGPGAWDDFTATPEGVLLQSHVEIKVRSWELGVGDYNWSVEIKLPTTAIAGTDWIDLTSPNHFGLYYNVIRMSAAPDDIILEGGWSSQFTWPRADYTDLSKLILHDGGAPGIGITNHVIPPDWLGEAVLSTAPGDCLGVKFSDLDYYNYSRGYSHAIGVVNPSDPTGPLSGAIDGFNMNTFEARVVNDGAADAEDVKATFRIFNYGLGPGEPEEWELVPVTGGTMTNPTDIQDINAGLGYEFQMEWQLDASERAMWLANPAHGDQCLLVLLDSDKNVNFVESSVRRNMGFVNLFSAYEREAVISGKGYPDPPAGKNHYDFLLIRNQRFLFSDKKYDGWAPCICNGDSKSKHAGGHETGRGIGGWLSQSIFSRWADAKEKVSTWVWNVNGYRNTGAVLTVGEKKFRVCQPVGSFGFAANKAGDVSKWESSLTGGGIRKDPDSDNIYALEVPEDGSVTINTKLDATGTGEPGKSCVAISVRLGGNIPQGDFDLIADPGLSFNVGLECVREKNVSLEAIFGYHRFPLDELEDSNIDIYQFSLNGRLFSRLSDSLTFFINGGGGLYKIKDGKSKFGWNIGAGFDYYISNTFQLEAAYNYHKLTKTDIQFSTVQGGFRFRF
jgi:opacity protein-like surface antigen